MTRYTDSFRAMDTEIDVEVEADAPPSAAFVSVRLLFAQQEERFSRFREESCLSRLNRARQVTEPMFARGVTLALEAAAFTGGLFNPMILESLEGAGYDRSFENVAGGEPASRPVREAAACLKVRGDAVERLTGRADLGGIIKGWTVDLAVEWLSEQHSNCLVNAGGDLRRSGFERDRAGWRVEVTRPESPRPLWRGDLRGALATSTTAVRRWKATDGSFAHHLIDPRTGLPAASPFVQVSARASECWRAEVWAKAILIGGPEAVRLAEEAGIPSLAVHRDGTVFESASWEAGLAPPTW